MDLFLTFPHAARNAIGNSLIFSLTIYVPELRFGDDLKILRKNKLRILNYYNTINTVQTLWRNVALKIICNVAYSKGILISFSCKTNSIHFHQFLGHLLILEDDCVKDLGVILYSKQ
jgi:hypothetical protein